MDVAEFRKAVGLRVRTARRKVYMSQTEISKLLGVRQATISEIELGKIQVDMTMLYRLSLVLGVPYIYFLHGKL
jgi:transcriptional regulator with XRE-family HTH domain